MRAVLIKLRLAVGSLVFIISGASVIRCIVTMGASFPVTLSRNISSLTLCSSSFGGARMALIVLLRILMSLRPLVVPAAIFVSFCNSSVSALRCAVGLRFGTWQCCGKSSADPEIRYAVFPGQSINCTCNDQLMVPNTMHLFLAMPTSRVPPELRR